MSHFYIKYAIHYQLCKIHDTNIWHSNNGQCHIWPCWLLSGEVIKGWDEGIMGKKIGSEFLLVVPPKLGYGGRKMGTIAPNSTLRFGA